ncbi:MAG: 2-polyprenyl-6-hydroxyphenyl methylase / 3-demethylubiquinone-9 3-methyltransferase [Parcubacteria group bacterium Gr01-1014_38]|nr:MAG: 2-polyprenyl-6-hydroxyphenyl methylase / 3-demethylubiquinone-9 3-methyltransferase [Parcubacteria group bacterium Gr01-1014_38]
MIRLYKFEGHQSSPTDWDQKYATESTTANNVAAYAGQPFVQTILRYLRVGQRVLDAGCGTGGLLRFLKQRGGNVTGVDASPVAVELLKRAAPDIPVHAASIERLPFPDASFDAYLAIGSWEYPPGGPGPAAREAARVLKPDGLAFIEVPQVSTLRRLGHLPLKRLEYLVKKMRKETPQFAHYLFTRSEMKTFLKELHFEIVEIQPHDLPEPDRHYGLWVDWPFLRGGPTYRLNALGRFVKTLGNALSPWTISTGMFIVARKK